jgi:hypothetical protein
MRQEQDEGEHDKDDSNQEEKDARRKPVKRLRQEDEKDAVEGDEMMTGIETTDTDGIGFVHLPGIDNVRHDYSS